jgi:hypothetical protein
MLTDIYNYFGMTATIIHNDPLLPKCMHINKVELYANAHAANKADEQATVHSRMWSTVSTALPDISYVWSHKEAQKTASQASQP